MSKYKKAINKLQKNKYTWLITGAAGFIGSHLLESLLKFNQKVIGLDNLSTGYEKNLKAVKNTVNNSQWRNFKFIKGDITNPSDCKKALKKVDYVSHQAALPSVPRSIKNPIQTNDNNLTGFLNLITQAKNANVKRLVYASSSSVYGDSPVLPKKEEKIGNLLSPYALTKYTNELYAKVYAKCYDFQTIGLRYFNIFGPRQDPNGPYAGVMPKWITNMIKKRPVYINGDGLTSRDFCYVENVVQANILATITTNKQALNQVYNIALNEQTSLNELFKLIKSILLEFKIKYDIKPIYRNFRVGDIKHSLADILKAKKLLGYVPEYTIEKGLNKYIGWYLRL